MKKISTVLFSFVFFAYLTACGNATNTNEVINDVLAETQAITPTEVETTAEPTTIAATEAPTEKETEAVKEETKEPETEAPTEAATEVPTEAPTEEDSDPHRIKEANAKYDEIAAQIFTAGMSDFDKANAIYRWVVSYFSYNDGKQEIYNDFRDILIGFTACSGYSDAVKELADRCNLECLCFGSRIINHAFNQVCVDGVWYVMDATSGKEGRYYEFLLSGEAYGEFWNGQFKYNPKWGRNSMSWNEIVYGDREAGFPTNGIINYEDVKECSSKKYDRLMNLSWAMFDANPAKYIQ